MELIALELPADLSISQLEEARNTLLEQVEQIDTVQQIKITDHNIIKIDTVGVQMLLALLRSLISKNLSIEWQISSAILIESIKQLGLTGSEFSTYLKQE